MKNYYLWSIICFLYLGLAGTELLAQTLPDQQIIEERDSTIMVNSELKIEILELRNRVAFLESKIKSLRGNVYGLTSKVKVLQDQEQKTKEEYDELEKYAREILASNDSIRHSNKELLVLNTQLSKSKESIEVAATALQTVLDKEREKMEAQAKSFKKNYASGCTDVTHKGKQGIVILDEENLHKISWIKDLNLQVNTCYALPREEASTNVKVYFYLYRADDTERKQPIENSVPIILTPNLVVSDEAVIYYEGTLDLMLPTKRKEQQELRTAFIYEVEYKEEIVAYGKFKLD